jgi:Ca-activated chloride channel family protein
VSFLWPIGFLALAGVPAAILIALWRARRRDVPVPSLMLWQRLAERISDTGQRRRKLVDASLVLAAIFALLAAVAVTGPMLSVPAKPGRAVLLVIDRSASMNMKVGGATRWESARQGLREFLAELTPADSVYLAASPAGDPARLGPLTPDEAAETLDAMRPTQRPADLIEDVATALAAAQALRPFETLVCTDTPELLPDGANAIGVGGTADNVFFTRFASSGSKVLLGVKNIGAARKTMLHLSADGRPAKAAPLDIGPGEEKTLILDAPELADARWVEARIAADDSLPADNHVYAAREPQRRVRVLLVGEGNLFVTRALEADPDVELIRGEDPGDTDDPLPYDMLVYNEAAPAKVRDCSTIVINPPKSFEGATIGGEVYRIEVTAVADDALTRNCGLSDINVNTARRITNGGTVLVNSNKGPLMTRSGKLVCLAFGLSLENTKWMLETGFPVFWAKLLEGASTDRRPGLAYTRLGDEAPLRLLGAKTTARRIHPNDGPEARYETDGFTFRPDRAGICRLKDATHERTIAFSMLSPEESSTQGTSKPFDEITNADPAAHGARDVPLMAAATCVALVAAMACWYVKR